MNLRIDISESHLMKRICLVSLNMSNSRPPSLHAHEHVVQAVVQPAIQQAIATAAPQHAQSGRARGDVNCFCEELMSLLCFMELSLLIQESGGSFARSIVSSILDVQLIP